jgi:hypothetical protein
MKSETPRDDTALEAAAKAAYARQNEELLKSLTGLVETLYEKGTAYTKLVLGVGYAGFFAVWAGTKDALTPRQRVLSALLIAFSLFFYVFYEVFQMLYQSIAVINFNKAASASADSVGQALQSFGRKQMVRDKWFMRIWFVVLCLTLVPALLGAFILFYSFVFRLVHTWNG